MIRGDDWDPPIARAVAETGRPIQGGLAAGLARSRVLARWLVVSELALGAALFLFAVRPGD